METKEQVEFVRKHLDRLGEYGIKQLYEQLWASEFNSSPFHVDKYGRPEAYRVSGFPIELIVDPDKETVEEAVDRVMSICARYFDGIEEQRVYRDMDHYRWQKVDIAPRFTITRADQLYRVIGTLTFIADGTAIDNYSEVYEFMEDCGADRSPGEYSAFEGVYRGVKLRGYRNGRLDVSGLTRDQQERLRIVKRLANLHPR